MTNGGYITQESLCLEPFDNIEIGPSRVLELPPILKETQSNSTKTLRDIEKEMICKTLNRVDGNKTKAAKLLGISVRTLWNKVNEYEMIENGKSSGI